MKNIKKKLGLNDLQENKNWKDAVIVFKPESFNKEFNETQRSYKISRENYYFQQGKISSSLYGSCLDGSDDGVRLDLYMKAIPEDKLGKRWIVDYCYIIE